MLKYTEMIDAYPDVSKFKRNLQSYEKPISFYWGSEVFGRSVRWPTRVKFNSEVLNNPLNETLNYQVNEVVLKPSSFPAIAFFSFKNVLVQNYKGFSFFTDIYLLRTGIESEDEFNMLDDL